MVTKLASDEAQEPKERNGPEILPSDVPVTMPELPASMLINTEQRYRAISDATRTKILNIVRHQPATAKQLAGRLGASPGSIGHHLKVLEEAGLVQVVARRISRGIVAKYYARSARIFLYNLPRSVGGKEVSASVEILSKATHELAEVEWSEGEKKGVVGFPHARLSPERASLYEERLRALTDEFMNEPDDPEGEVYGLCLAFFAAPAYMQRSLPDNSPETGNEPGDYAI